MSARLRPTLRCLQRDLGIPPQNLPHETDLSEFCGHRMIETARSAVNSGKELETVMTHPEGVVWLEIEQRDPEWRGVVWKDDQEKDLYWLVTAGKHQEDSGNDFWRKLARAQDLDKRQPNEDDRARLKLEEPARIVARDTRTAKEMMLRATSHLGSVQRELIFGVDVEVRVTDLGDQVDSVLVGLTIRGKVQPEVEALILRTLVPGSNPDPVNGNDWAPAHSETGVVGEQKWETYWEHSELVQSCR